MESPVLSKPRRIRVLSKPQQKLLQAMIGCVSVKEAAIKLGWKPKTAYNILGTIRRKYRKARMLVNTIDAQKRRSVLFKRVLTDRLSAGEEEVEELEW